MMVEDDAFDAAMAAIAVPVRSRRPIVAPVLRELTATPRRVAACVVWLVAVCVSAAAITTTTATVGNATAHCGLDVYVYGYPDGAVAHACRHAEAGRAIAFVPALGIVIVGLATVLMGVELVRRRVVDAPVHATLIGLGSVGALVAAFALRPATAELINGGAVTTAHCGLDTYLFGHADAAVSSACTRAFSSHAHVLLGGLVVALVGAAAAGHLLWRAGRERASRLLVGVVLGAGVTVAVVGAFRPVSVAVPDGGATVVASCGLDSVVAGYPDHAVEEACRAHLHTHVAAVAGAAAVAGVGFAGLVISRRRPEGDPAAGAET